MEASNRVKAIETHYAGCHFRSRLEARWAVFFDTLRIEWEYEPQGYAWEGRTYLPDFWLPSIETWFEVKGQRQTEEECSLHWEFAAHTGRRHITAVGDIPRSLADSWGHESMYLDGESDHCYRWCQCLDCDKFGIEFEGRADRICRHPDRKYYYQQPSPSIDKALVAARSARFEHGQSGAPAFTVGSPITDRPRRRGNRPNRAYAFNPANESAT